MPKSVRNDLPELKLIDNKTIGERIAQVRKNKGLTQLELAEKIGIKRALLSDYEIGRTRIFGEMVIRIALALQVSPNRLFGFEKEESEDKISLRYTKRIKELEELPEYKRRIVLKALDDSIKANKD